mgnify:CR=1 FL=1
MTNMEIGNRIRETREEKRLSREDLAANSEISTKFLYEIENGKKGLSAATLLKISRSLDCSCDYILTGIDNPYKKSNELLNIVNKFDTKQQKRILKILKLIHEIIVNK